MVFSQNSHLGSKKWIRTERTKFFLAKQLKLSRTLNVNTWAKGSKFKCLKKIYTKTLKQRHFNRTNISKRKQILKLEIQNTLHSLFTWVEAAAPLQLYLQELIWLSNKLVERIMQLLINCFVVVYATHPTSDDLTEKTGCMQSRMNEMKTSQPTSESVLYRLENMKGLVNLDGAQTSSFRFGLCEKVRTCAYCVPNPNIPQIRS